MCDDRCVKYSDTSSVVTSKHATLCTALFKRGLRNQFIQGVEPLSAKDQTMVGQACTLRYIPAREDLNPLSVFQDSLHPQRLAVEQCPAGYVMVMDSRKDARAGSAGSILVTRMMVRGVAVSAAAEQRPMPLFDAHLHYSHDAWENLPPRDAVALLRKAGLKYAMVSSSSDDGTQMLYAEAPDLIVPSLRPYRKRGETGSWLRDESVIGHVEARLAKHKYVAIGEYHVYGADADLPVMRRMVELAREYGLYLHSHSDADAIERQFAQDPDARILWAHSGFDSPAEVARMLRKHKNLWADLAFRSDHSVDGKVDPAWRKVFLEFPDRFMIGTDTFTPERWYYVQEHADWSRAWLADLPPEVAERIAHRNGEELFAKMMSSH